MGLASHVSTNSFDAIGGLRYNARGDIVFVAASLGVVMSQATHTQDFYMYVSHWAFQL